MTLSDQEARATLARRQRDVGLAAENQNAVRARFNRLAGKPRELTQARAQRDALATEFNLVLGEHIASPCPTGPRPEPSPELLAAEARVAELEREDRAAAAVIARLQPLVAAADAAVTVAAQQRTIASFAVVRAEAARIVDKLAGRVRAVCELDDLLMALSDTLFAIGRNAADPEIASAASTTGTAVTQLRLAAGSRADSTHGPLEVCRRFVDQLQVDADASLKPR